MNKYKLIAIDIDDTLLNDDLQVTGGTKEALEEAVGRGVLITLATGRMFASAKPFALQIGLNMPIITYQGSLVKTPLDDHVLYERFVPPQIAAQIDTYCDACGLHLQAYWNDRLLVKSDNDKVRHYAQLTSVPYEVVADLTPYLQKSSKLLIIDESERLDHIADQWKNLFGCHIHLTKSKPYFLELLHPEGTKGHALRYLANHFQCDMSQVIAIGDSWNDREMLQTAGLGVAMGNAVESLKQIADYITGTNNEEGVKSVIEKFILFDN